MQLMIDTNQETRETLLLASRFLADHAALLPAAESAPGINGPGHKIELLPDVSVPEGTLPAAPPAPSNVLPFIVPPAPTAPSLPAVTNAATPPASGTPVSAPVAGNVFITDSPTAPAADTAVAVEYDSAGLAWDERIHQTTRKKKSDGTWMLKRRIDATLVEQVTKELLARKGDVPVFAPPAPPAQDPAAVFGPAEGSAPAAAAAVILPPTDLLVPPAYIVPPMPAASAGVSVPIVPNGPVVAPPAAPAANAPAAPAVSAAVPPANPLRDFVMKCSRLTSSGMITKEQQDAALQQAGVPGMQALAQMQHLIPQADYFVSKAAGLVA